MRIHNVKKMCRNRPCIHQWWHRRTLGDNKYLKIITLRDQKRNFKRAEFLVCETNSIQLINIQIDHTVFHLPQTNVITKVFVFQSCSDMYNWQDSLPTKIEIDFLKTCQITFIQGRCHKHAQGGAVPSLGGLRINFRNFRVGSHQYQQFQEWFLSNEEMLGV